MKVIQIAKMQHLHHGSNHRNPEAHKGTSGTARSDSSGSSPASGRPRCDTRHSACGFYAIANFPRGLELTQRKAAFMQLSILRELGLSTQTGSPNCPKPAARNWGKEPVNGWAVGCPEPRAVLSHPRSQRARALTISARSMNLCHLHMRAVGTPDESPTATTTMGSSVTPWAIVQAVAVIVERLRSHAEFETPHHVQQASAATAKLIPRT